MRLVRRADEVDNRIERVGLSDWFGVSESQLYELLSGLGYK